MTDVFAITPILLIGVIHLRPLPGAPRWKGRFGEVAASRQSAAVNAFGVSQLLR